MRRAVLVTAILVIVLLAQLVTVEANPYGSHPITQPTLIVRSPTSRNYGDSTFERPFLYRNASFDISLNYMIPKNFTQVDSFSYKIDNSPTHSLNTSNVAKNFVGDISYSVFNTVDNLSSGIYNLKVYAKFVNGTTTQILESFVKIDLSAPPNPLFPLIIACVALVVLSLTSILFFSVKNIKKLKRAKPNGNSN